MNQLKIVCLVISSLVLLLVTVQCSKKESTLAPNVAKLVGTWQLIDPDSTYAVTLTIALDTANPPHDVTPFLITGKASVNEYSGRLFAVLDGTISAANFSNTDVAGSSQVRQFEQIYFDQLTSVARYEFPTDNRLRLFHGGQQPGVLTYKRIN